MPPPRPQDTLLGLPGPPCLQRLPLPFSSFWSLLPMAALWWPGSCFSLGDPPVTRSPCISGEANLCGRWDEEGGRQGNRNRAQELPRGVSSSEPGRAVTAGGGGGPALRKKPEASSQDS